MAIATNTYKRLRGHSLTVLERHQHAHGYIAVVLSGGYEEAGDRGCFRVQAGRDADSIVRLAEKDASKALAEVIEATVSARRSVQDWPHALAEALREDLHLRLDAWASEQGLADATVSRGFGRVFGISPKAYRAKQRAQMALRLALQSDHALTDVAITTGFSDQAHMTRTVHAMTGWTPGAWRRHVKWIQDTNCISMAC
jgi:AraC-like DNA-binding protein